MVEENDQLIQEPATVVSRDGEHVWVESFSRSACGSCGSSGHCGTGMLAGLLGQRRNLLRMHDHLGLKVGEQVMLGLSSGQLVKAAALTYLLPLLLMVFISIGASTRGFSDSGVMVAALLGLVTGFLLVRQVSRRRGSGLVQVRLLGRMPGMNEQPIRFLKLTGDM